MTRPRFLARRVGYEFAYLRDNPITIAVVDRYALAELVRDEVKRLDERKVAYVTLPGTIVQWLNKVEGKPFDDVIDDWVTLDSEWAEVPADFPIPSESDCWYVEETTFYKDGSVGFIFREKYDENESELPIVEAEDLSLSEGNDD